MEYKLFKTLRLRYKIPFLIRLFFGVFFIVFSWIPIILPIFPGSIFLWLFLLSSGFILVISPSKIRHLIKMRKSIIYLFKNFHRKNVLKYKLLDIKIHVLKIIKKDKPKKHIRLKKYLTKK